MKLLALYLWLCGSVTNRVTLMNTADQPMCLVRFDQVAGYQPELRLAVYEFQADGCRVQTTFRLEVTE